MNPSSLEVVTREGVCGKKKLKKPAPTRFVWT